MTLLHRIMNLNIWPRLFITSKRIKKTFRNWNLDGGVPTTWVDFERLCPGPICCSLSLFSRYGRHLFTLLPECRAFPPMLDYISVENITRDIMFLYVNLGTYSQQHKVNNENSRNYLCSKPSIYVIYSTEISSF